MDKDETRGELAKKVGRGLLIILAKESPENIGGIQKALEEKGVRKISVEKGDETSLLKGEYRGLHINVKITEASEIKVGKRGVIPAAYSVEIKVGEGYYAFDSIRR